MASEISFKTTKEEFATIGRIADRWKSILSEHRAALGPSDFDRMSVMMDLAACHANGNPVRFADLLAADDFNFIHDVGGIQRHLNRETGRLEDFFSPRFSQRANPKAEITSTETV